MKIYGLVLCLIFLFGCFEKKVYGSSDNLENNEQIIRFDNDLYQYLTQNGTDESLDIYKSLLNEYGEKVIYIGQTDSYGFYERLRLFFSDSTLMDLYRSEQSQLNDLSEINTELFTALDILLQHFPILHRPTVYMHVSGLNQNVIVTNEILSLSADKYLGSNLPLYKQFFYEYQRRLMLPERIVPDYLLGFMLANLPFKGDEDVLLDRMLYEGKLRYILSQLIPNRKEWEYIGYDQKQYMWCNTQKSKIWQTILKNQHLFSKDNLITLQYIKEAPYTATLPIESPDRVGIWLGYQIIVSYMKHHPEVSLQELINNIDYPELLKQAKFHP